MKNYKIIIENNTLGNTREINRIGDNPQLVHKTCMMEDIQWAYEEITKIIDKDEKVTVFDKYKGFV